MPTPTPRTAAFIETAKKYGIDDHHSEAIAICFGDMERELSVLTDTLDMMRDEFQRIIACPGCNAEIEDLANRAQLNLIQHVPVIVQRDRAEAELAKARAEIAVLRSKLCLAQPL